MHPPRDIIEPVRKITCWDLFCWTGSCAAIIVNQHRARYLSRKIRDGMIFFLQARNNHEKDHVAPIAPSPIIRQSCHAYYLAMIERKNTKTAPVTTGSHKKSF
jgi:hypothetical protein